MFANFLALLVLFVALVKASGDVDFGQNNTYIDQHENIFKCYIDEDNVRVCPDPIIETYSTPFVAIPGKVDRPMHFDDDWGYMYEEWRWRYGIDHKQPVYVNPGDVDIMFQNMIVNFTKYKPVVLHKDPWVVILDEFITEEEAKSIIAVGAKHMR